MYIVQVAALRAPNGNPLINLILLQGFLFGEVVLKPIFLNS